MQLEDRGSANHHLEIQIHETTHQGTVRQHILKEALPGALEELCGWREGKTDGCVGSRGAGPEQEPPDLHVGIIFFWACCLVGSCVLWGQGVLGTG